MADIVVDPDQLDAVAGVLGRASSMAQAVDVALPLTNTLRELAGEPGGPAVLGAVGSWVPAVSVWADELAAHAGSLGVAAGRYRAAETMTSTLASHAR